MLNVPTDFEQLLAVSKTPFLINAAEVNEQYHIEAQAKGDEILSGGRYKPGYEKT